jgi:hypothetical protein
MLRQISVAMMGPALLVTASGCALKTEEAALKADREKCENAGGLFVNGFCEMDGT